MATLDALKKDLQAAITASDRARTETVYRALLEHFPETAEGGDAAYRLGLDALMVTRDMEAAANLFRIAAKAKHPLSAQARAALGVVLLRQGKPQQGVFELRKAAGATPPNLQSATAAGLLVMALRESGQGKEAERAHGEHKRILEKVAASNLAEEAALAHFMLAIEHKHNGERGLAKRHLLEAIAKNALPPVELGLAEQALKEV